MKEIKPLRVSDWSGTPESSSISLPQIPAAPPAAGSDEPSDRPDPTPPKPPATLYAGFDLLRLPQGVLRRWWLPVPLALVGALLGIAGGFALFSPTYSVNVRLIVRNPQTFAVSEHSYSPSRLQPTTLLGAIQSPQVAREVISRLALDVSPRRLLDMVTVAEVKRTEFVDITVSTPYGPAETAQLATTWAEEAIRFTRRLQSDESVEMKAYLEEQLRRNDREIEQVNAKLLRFTEEQGVVDTSKEMDSYLASISDLNMRYETGRVDLEAVDYQLGNLRAEIRKHSPTFDDLKKAEIKLQELGEYYTDKNPIYLEELDKVDALRRKVESELKSESLGASDFTGTFVGNAIYMQIIELESRRETLVRTNEQVRKMLDEARAKLKELPNIALEMAPLAETSAALRASRDVLLKRMQEVEVFEEIAPGYYKMFKAPTAKDVAIKGTGFKKILLMVFAAMAFGGLGLAMAALMEFLDATVRTVPEASLVLAAPCIFALPSNERLESSSTLGQEIWAAVVGALAPAGRMHAFWQPCPSPQTDAFWRVMIEQASSMRLRVLVVHLAGEVPSVLAALPRVAPHETALTGAPRVALWELPGDLSIDALGATLATLASARSAQNEIWLHASGLVREPAAALARAADRTTVLFTKNAAVRDFWSTQRTLLAARRPLGGFLAMADR